MAISNLIRAFRQAGFDTLTCPVGNCAYHHREMSLQGFMNHIRGAHLKPLPQRWCPHPGCTVTDRDPGMRVHVESIH